MIGLFSFYQKPSKLLVTGKVMWGSRLRNSELIFILLLSFFLKKKSETQGTWMRPGDEQRIKSWHDDKPSSSSSTTTTTPSSTNQEK